MLDSDQLKWKMLAPVLSSFLELSEPPKMQRNPNTLKIAHQNHEKQNGHLDNLNDLNLNVSEKLTGFLTVGL